MSIQQIEALWPEQPAQQLRNLGLRKQRQLKRSLIRSRRKFVATVRRQYYLMNAWGDSRRALAQNEDIAITSIILIMVLSFSAISVLASTIYTFVMSAGALSTLLGANLLLVVLLALGVIAVSMAWLAAFLQNSLSIALMEGATRRQHRSLRLTGRKSLRYASSTASAWFLLLTAALAPAGVISLVNALIIERTHVGLATALPYLVGVAILGLIWISWVLATYTLVPYVRLFEAVEDWGYSLKRSRHLVRNKGKLFILSGYLVLGVSLAGLYGLAHLLEATFHCNSTIAFMMLSVLPVSIANAVMTAFYRKRKLARK